MKKSILNLGKALNKAEQKSINGGAGGGTGDHGTCLFKTDCDPGYACTSKIHIQPDGTVIQKWGYCVLIMHQ